MTHKAVLLDTSFFIRFLNESDPLFKNADGYFRYFLQKEISMMIQLSVLLNTVLVAMFTNFLLEIYKLFHST